MYNESAVLDTIIAGRRTYADHLRRHVETSARAVELKREELAQAEQAAEAVRAKVATLEAEIQLLRDQVASWNQKRAKREETVKRFPSLASAVADVEHALAQAATLLLSREQEIDDLRRQAEHPTTLQKELTALQQDHDELLSLLQDEDSPTPAAPENAPLAEEQQVQRQIQELKARFDDRKNGAPATAVEPPEGQRPGSTARAVAERLRMQAQALDCYVAPQSRQTQHTKRDSLQTPPIQDPVTASFRNAVARLDQSVLVTFRDWYLAASDSFAVLGAVRSTHPTQGLLRKALQTAAHAVSALTTLASRAKLHDEGIKSAFEEVRRIAKEDLIPDLRHMSFNDPADPLRDLDTVRTTLAELLSHPKQGGNGGPRPARTPRGPTATMSEVPATGAATVDEVVKTAQVEFADVLVFGDDVADGVSRLPKNLVPPQRVFSCLETMATATRALQKARPGLALKDWLRQKYGLRVQDDTGKVRNNKREKHGHTWHDGTKPRLFRLYIKVNEIGTTDDGLRIYFAWDGECQRLLIGWIGKPG